MARGRSAVPMHHNTILNTTDFTQDHTLHPMRPSAPRLCTGTLTRTAPTPLLATIHGPPACPPHFPPWYRWRTLQILPYQLPHFLFSGSLTVSSPPPSLFSRACFFACSHLLVSRPTCHPSIVSSSPPPPPLPSTPPPPPSGPLGPLLLVPWPRHS